MASFTSIALLSLIGAVTAGYIHGGTSYIVVTKHEAPHYGNGNYLEHGPVGKYYEPKHYEPMSYPKYSFDYGVKDVHTGDEKSQWEHRDGDRVKGGYTLKEADGTTRIVEYAADDHSGFNAVVKNIGHAYHPQVYKSYDHGADLHSVGGHGVTLGLSSGGHGLASSYINVKQHTRI